MHLLADWDHAALHWINSHHAPPLDWLLIAVSFLGEAGGIWVLTGLGMLIFGERRTKRLGLLLLGTMLAGELICWALGAALYRTRPYLAGPGVRQLGVRWAGDSFPSAHALSVGIAAILLGSEYRRLRWPLAAFALLTLYSRPYLGMHHPLDVLIGAAVGAAVGLAARRLRRGKIARPGIPSQD